MSVHPIPVRLFTVALAVLAPCQYALAAKTPASLATDHRVKQVVFDPNQVVEITGTYGFQTSIEFSHEERIKVVSLGDTIAWQTVPYQNRLFLKPVEPNATTNLTVLTDKRTYYFRLSSARTSAAQTYLVRFIYPNAAWRLPSGAASPGPVAGKTPGGSGARLNRLYGTAGRRDAFGLVEVFDDGQFTYFLFADGSEIPAVYAVGNDGSESIVSTRREGDYLVVERTGRLFTLRNGMAHLCVRNEALIKPVSLRAAGKAPDRKAGG